MIYSLEFLAFVLVLLVVYWLLPVRFRWMVLLAGNAVFYAYNSRFYAVFMVVTIVLSYCAALRLERLQTEITDKAERKRKKQLVVLVVTVFCVGLLVFFKSGLAGAKFGLLLPLGISYYSFQTIGYIVDVYRGKCSAERNIFRYALFVSYFPAMIQGPINRYKLLDEQFSAERQFSYARIRSGAWLFLWGLFKKLVIADRCAVAVGAVFGENMSGHSGSVMLAGLIMFIIQMYGDFSGGIDMVEGISEMFGIEMYRNFRQPFFSRSIGEYWRRWHISLGNWIKDYVFFPMALSSPYRKLSKLIGKKNKHLGRSIPSMVVTTITFIIIGLWHEVSLNYLCYGLWFGIIIGLSEVLEPVFERINCLLGINTEVLSHRIFQRVRTWLIVLVGESFSILPGFGAFVLLMKAVFTDFRYYELFYGLYELGLAGKDFVVLAVALLIWWGVSFMQDAGHKLRAELALQGAWLRWGLTVGIILFVVIFGWYGPGFNAADFLYGGI